MEGLFILVTGLCMVIFGSQMPDFLIQLLLMGVGGFVSGNGIARMMEGD